MPPNERVPQESIKESATELRSSKIEDGLALCGEIIVFTTPHPEVSLGYIHREEVLTIREEATKLSLELHQIDRDRFAYDDNYYRIHSQIATLRQKFEVLRKKISRDTLFQYVQPNYPLNRISPEEAASFVKRLLENKDYTSIGLGFTNPYDRHTTGYGDNCTISIYKNQGENHCFRISFSEVIDPGTYEDIPYIHHILEALTAAFPEHPLDLQIRRREHELGGIEYRWWENVATVDDILKIVRAIVHGIQDSPRVPKATSPGTPHP